MQSFRNLWLPDELPENKNLGYVCPRRPNDYSRKVGFDAPIKPATISLIKESPYPLCAPKGLRADTWWGSRVSLPSLSTAAPGGSAFPLF